MAPIQPTLYGAKDGFISGNLDYAESLTQFSKTLDKAYAVLVAKALDSMTSNVRSAAESDYEWHPYAHMITAAFHDGEFMYTLHGTAADHAAIEHLEYGGPDRAPTMFLTKTLLKEIPALTKMLEMEIV